MEWIAAALVLSLTLFLCGAVWTCWKGREKPARSRVRLPLKVRIVCSPKQTPKPEGMLGKMAYADQVLSQCVADARSRVQVLSQLDGQLRKPSSSLECSPKP